MISDDPYDYCEDEKEAEWRNEAVWSIPNFFELLKNQFKKLHFIPICSMEVIAEYGRDAEEEEGMREMLRGIYREHGWPDLNQYRKEQCLKAVGRAMRMHYPGRAGYHQLDEDEEDNLEAKEES